MLKLEAHGKLLELVNKHLVYFLTANYGDLKSFAAKASSRGVCSERQESNDRIMTCTCVLNILEQQNLFFGSDSKAMQLGISDLSGNFF